MSVGAIRARAQAFDARNRLTGGLTGLLLVAIVGIELWQIWVHPDILERVGDALTVAAILVSAYQLRHYYAPMPAALGETASVDFYRMQLSRQHEMASRPWRFLVLFVPGITLSIIGPIDRPVGQLLAAAAVMVAVFVGVAWVNARTARQIRAEIDRLG